MKPARTQANISLDALALLRLLAERERRSMRAELDVIVLDYFDRHPLVAPPVASSEEGREPSAGAT